jgi:hypothetical protein
MYGTRQFVGLLTTTLLAVGLFCVPASAQDDDDDEPRTSTWWLWSPIYGGAIAGRLPTQSSSPSQKGNFRPSVGPRPTAQPRRGIDATRSLYEGRSARPAMGQMLQTPNGARPYFPPIGWKYSNLKVTFEPQSHFPPTRWRVRPFR